MPMTVGEANMEDGISRSYLWRRAIFLQLIFFAGALGLAYACYSIDIARSPGRLLAAVAWLPIVSLYLVIESYVSLSLPLAPIAAVKVPYIMTLVGTPILMIGSFAVVYYGHTAALIAFGSTVVVVLAVLLACWYWLDHTYRAVDDYLPS